MRNHRVVLMALIGLALTEAKLSRDERSALRVERRLAPIGGTHRVENSTATQVNELLRLAWKHDKHQFADRDGYLNDPPKKLSPEAYEASLPARRRKYDALGAAGKLYWLLRGALTDDDLDYVQGRWCTFPTGCVSMEFLNKFLEGKWIPPREPIEEDAAKQEMALGHWFSKTYATRIHSYSLLEDFAVYMRSRPRDAVQRPVRRLIAAAYQHSFDDKSWPGSSLPRAAFRPKFEGGLFNDTDTRRLVYPDARCRLSCRVQAMRDLRLPESMALAEGEAGEDVKLLPNGKLDDVVNQYSLHQLEEEERELLFRHRVDAVMTVAPFLLVVALPAAFLVYLLKHQSSPAALRSALEHMRLKQQFESRQLDWAQWMRTTKFAGAGPPNSGSGFVGAVSYTAPAWDTNQRGRGEVYPASQSALNDHWRGVGSKPDRPAVSM